MPDFKLLNKSSILERVDGVSDNEMYHQLLSSFKDLNFSDLEINNIFKLTYFILCLGNDDIELINKIGLELDLDLEILENYLNFNKIKVGFEIIEKKRNTQERKLVLESVCQNLYLVLFKDQITKIIANNL